MCWTTSKYIDAITTGRLSSKSIWRTITWALSIRALDALSPAPTCPGSSARNTVSRRWACTTHWNNPVPRSIAAGMTISCATGAGGPRISEPSG
ncbi:Uncharacterised protein [Bordetella pertussis]|nr:Uncharacterised protein [Bordetella pertussis]